MALPQIEINLEELGKQVEQALIELDYSRPGCFGILENMACVGCDVKQVCAAEFVQNKAE